MAKRSKRKGRNAIGRAAKKGRSPSGKGNRIQRVVDHQLSGLEEHSEPNSIPIALKYFDHSHQCFSTWPEEDLKGFTDLVRKLSKMSWAQVFQQGGRLGQKTGLGYTLHRDRSVLPEHKVLDNLSEDITFFELRATQRARVHGFRSSDWFFLVWLDRNHDIYPQ